MSRPIEWNQPDYRLRRVPTNELSDAELWKAYHAKLLNPDPKVNRQMYEYQASKRRLLNGQPERQETRA